MKPFYKRNWFWFVGIPTALIAVSFATAWLLRVL
jgi:hypothetical protein